MSCGVVRRRGLDPTLLWLWRRPVPTAPIRPLAWEPPYAVGAPQEMAKRPKKKKRTGKCCTTNPTPHGNSLNFFFFFFLATPVAYGSSRARGCIRASAEAYATATATPDSSHIFDLCHSLLQRQILNPLSKARDQICILTGTTSGS